MSQVKSVVKTKKNHLISKRKTLSRKKKTQRGGTVEIDRTVKKMLGAVEISQSFLKNMYNMIRHKNIREAIINLILVKEGGGTHICTEEVSKTQKKRMIL